MSSNVETQPEAEPRKVHRGSPVVFAIAVTVAASSIAALAVWPIVDASYAYGWYMAQVDLGLKTVKGAPGAAEIGLTRAIVDIANRWDQLGPRIALFIFVCAMGIVATGWIAISCVRVRSTGRLVAAVAVCCAWIALIACDPSIQSWSVRRHAIGLLPRVEIAAAALRAHWPEPTNRSPTKTANVAPDLEVVVSDEFPDAVILLGRKSYPIREDFGMLIDRSHDGAIRFSLRGAAGWNLEWHPAGSEPETYIDGLGNESSPVDEWTKLKEDWYLVRYGDS